MSKPVIMEQWQWEKILEQIRNEYVPSTYLVRNKMRKALGFTVRRHEEWVKGPPPLWYKNLPETEQDCGPNGWNERKCTVRLDFYDEPKRIMFLLKYSSILGEKERA